MHALIVNARINGTDLLVVALASIFATPIDHDRFGALSIDALIQGTEFIIVALGIGGATVGDIPVEALLLNAPIISAGIEIITLEIRIAAFHRILNSALSLNAGGLGTGQRRGGAVAGIVAAALL